MFLNGSFLGLAFLDRVFSVAESVQYDKLEIFGSSKIDKVRVLNTNSTEEEVNALRYTDIYSWTPNVLLLAEFSNSLNAGNIQGLTSPITTWEVYRKESDETVFELLKTFDVEIESYYDYTARAYRNYDYRIFAKNSTEISTPLDTETVYTDWYHWSLIDPDTGIVYLFDLDLASGQINRTQNVSYYESSFSKYNQVSYGQQDYISGSISATAGSIDCSEEDTLDYDRDFIEQFGDFINNKKNKILKSRYGEAWVVSTSDFNYKHRDVIQRQLATISFSFRQVDDL